MLDKIIGNKKILFVIDILLLIISIKCYKYIYDVELLKNTFGMESEKFVEENANPVFKVSKIILYSSAYAVDKSENGKLEDINISQFTDMAIYIDNKGKSSEITAENTVNEMFIDNIEMTTNSSKGEHIFNYKNPQNFGKYMPIENYRDDGILMNVIKTNEEENVADYGNNVFFTDCSNPLTLGFVNKNFLTNCKISKAKGSLLFDGSILKNANVDLSTISGKINFSIHIKNNLGETFECSLSVENDFTEDEEGISTGYVMKIQNTEDEKYNFLKVIEH